jgi:hypothetical protein
MNALTSPQIDHLLESAAERGLPSAVAPVAVGLVLVVLFFAAAMWANSRRRAEPPPRPEEQPRPPEHPAHIEDRREPDDFGAESGHIVPHRLTPHEMKGYGNFGTRPVSGERPAQDEESGGAFGSGQHGG